MMISQPAWWCLEAAFQQLLRRPLIEPDAERVPEFALALTEAHDREDEAEPRGAATTVVPSATSSILARTPDVPLGGPLTAAERRARAAALRALALSRGRRFDAARSAFTDAATLDPTLDLTRTPAFWKLERAAHEAAIDAYVAAGRNRDAAVLRARVRSTFRPRALRPRPEPVLSQ